MTICNLCLTTMNNECRFNSDQILTNGFSFKYANLIWSEKYKNDK